MDDRQYLVDLAMSFYVNEPCRICGKLIQPEDLHDLVYDGYGPILTMTTLLIDPDPIYRAHWIALGADAVCTLTAALAYIESNPPYDKIIISSRLLDCIPELVRRGLRVEVATAMPGTAEAAEAYRAGASEYFIKSFNL